MKKLFAFFMLSAAFAPMVAHAHSGCFCVITEKSGWPHGADKAKQVDCDGHECRANGDGCRHVCSETQNRDDKAGAQEGGEREDD